MSYRSKDYIEKRIHACKIASQVINNQIYRNMFGWNDVMKILRAVTLDYNQLEQHQNMIFVLMKSEFNQYWIERMRTLILKELNITLNKGSLSRIAAIDIEFKIPSYKYSYLNWPEVLSDPFRQKEPRYGYFTGLPGWGKTHKAVWMTEQITKQNKGITVVSNITMKSANTGPKSQQKNIQDRLIHVTKASDLLKLEPSHRKKQYYLFILDEAGINWSKADWRTNRNQVMIGFCKVCRKIGVSMILIDQQYDSLPAIIKEWSTFFISCKKNKSMVIKTDIIQHHIKNIPDIEKINWNTFENPSFEIDIDDKLELLGVTNDEFYRESKSDLAATQECGLNACDNQTNDV